MAKKTITELVQFLHPDAREDLKLISLQYLSGVSCDRNGSELLQKKDIVTALVLLLTNENVSDVHLNEVYKILINATSEESFAWKFIHNDSAVVPYLFHYINNKQSSLADHACKVLSNVTHHERCCKYVMGQLEEFNINLENILHNFFQEDFNTQKNNLHYFGAVLSNITQLQKYRLFVLNKDNCLIQQLLAFVSYSKSLIRRGGIIGAIRNCCFETEYHSWLIGDDVDIVPRMLLPLAGGEEFEDDEVDKLAGDLQYLSPEKKREPDEDIRNMIIDALTQLCATRLGRDTLRAKGAYYILREHHKWEKNEMVKQGNENLAEILIRDEEDIGVDNLHTLNIGRDKHSTAQEERTDEGNR